MGWNDFRLPVVGTKYTNDDGSSRQEELRLCSPGERVTLERQPDNPHDRRAVAVISCRGTCLGYLSRTHCWVGSKIDRGYDVRAVVERVKAPHVEDDILGLVILINMEGDDPTIDGDAAQPFDPADAIAA